MRIEELYDRFGGRVYHYLSVKLGSPADAEDVLQEVFCRLVRYRVRLGLIRSPQALVFRIARNEALRLLARKNRMPSCNPGGYNLDEAISAGMEGPDPGELKRMASALAGLPEDQREVIVLKFFEELTFREIASVCGISPHTAASRCRYGMAKLRSFLEEKK